jgi:hypothetical protein
VTFDTVVYLLLAVLAFLLICIPTLLGSRASSLASAMARRVSFIGFLLLILGSVLASSCRLGDCLNLVSAIGVGAVFPYLWFFAPGIFFSLAGWALALMATDRRTDSRRFMLILFAPLVIALGALVVGGAAALSSSNPADAWIATVAYLVSSLPLVIMLAAPKRAANLTPSTTTRSAPEE